MQHSPLILGIAVQDRQRLFRDGLALVLHGEPDLDVFATAATAAELVSVVTDRIDVVVLELDTSDWDAYRLVAALRKHHPRLVVVGISAEEPSRSSLLRAYQAGVTTVLPRSAGIRTLLHTIRNLPRYASAPGSRQLVLLDDRPSLTDRETQVLEAIASGATTREIAAVLGISPKTVEKYKHGIFSKLGVQNQVHAVAVALRQGLLDSPVALMGTVA
jgi:DNA-binding NarL/FixJ family response regulator